MKKLYKLIKPIRKHRYQSLFALTVFLYFQTIASAHAQEIYFRFIAPEKTDTGILSIQETQHYMARPVMPVSGNNKLMILLPGTKGKPRNFLRICDEAARMGYHVLALVYPNTWNFRKLCQESTDDACYENIRREIILGEDVSAHVEVKQANSIVNRIRATLQYGHENDREGKWNSFLNAENLPEWNSIVIVGHSQGAGHAALIGKMYRTQRIIMISGPNDFYSGQQTPASWLSLPSLTPLHAYYMFLHKYDNSIPYSEQILQAKALGLTVPGTIFEMDSNIKPGSRLIIAGLDAGSPYTHLSLAVDSYTPTDDQHRPVYLPAWRYLLRFP